MVIVAFLQLLVTASALLAAKRARCIVFSCTRNYNKPNRNYVGETFPPELDPARRAEARDEWDAVVQAMNTLTEEQRQVLVGRLILGYDVATVVRMLGKKANAIKALQFRALQRERVLRGRLFPEHAFPLHTRQKEDVP